MYSLQIAFNDFTVFYFPHLREEGTFIHMVKSWSSHVRIFSQVVSLWVYWSLKCYHEALEGYYLANKCIFSREYVFRNVRK